MTSGDDYRPVPLEDVVARFSPERQERVRQRTRQILLEEATLRELRRARGLTKERMAEILEIAQENVSRLEGRADIKLSSLAAYVQALGGSLELRATFPDGSSVPLKHASAAVTSAERHPGQTRSAPRCDCGGGNAARMKGADLLCRLLIGSGCIRQDRSREAVPL